MQLEILLDLGDPCSLQPNTSNASHGDYEATADTSTLKTTVNLTRLSRTCCLDPDRQIVQALDTQNPA